MRRPIWAYLIVFTSLLLFASFTWLTRNPHSEVLDRAASWPYVGPLASRFTAIYRPPRERPAEAVAPVAEEVAASEAAAPPPARRFDSLIYVLKGQELKSRPDAGAATLYRFERHTRAGKIGQRGDWYHLDYHGREGWVLLENYDENAEIPYGEGAEPTLPVASRPPDPQRLEAARKYLRGRERELRVGPYTLYTDSADDGLIAYLDAVAAPLDGVYAERFGLTPVDRPAEAVVLYQSDIAYRLLQRRTEELAGLASAGHNSKGVAVLYVGGRRWSEVAATLVHELVHFINRRAIGPQLPPWIDEGLADDLAQARIDDDGVVHPGELGGERRQQDGRFRLEGAFSTLWQLHEAAREDRLPTLEWLAGLEWQRFVQPPAAQLHYGVSSFWVRFLLADEAPRRAAAFRAFLSSVAAGQPPTVENLQTRLGEDWPSLDAGFEAWIVSLAEHLELPAGAG